MTSPPLRGLVRQRAARDQSQAELAQVIGCTQSQLHKFETGAVRLDVYRAAKLARHLQCRIEDLL